MYKKWDESPKEKPDISEKLPLKITSVSTQKKRKDRFSLFHDDTFLVGVSSQTLIDLSIKKGVELTPFLFEKILEAEEYQKIKDTFYDYLSRRDHGSFELKQKALKKGFPSNVIDDVLDEFDQKGLLNDESFAKKFAADKAEFKNWGPIKIKAALRKKGVSNRVAEKAVQTITNDLDQVQICVDLLTKRKRHFFRETDTLKRKQKMYRYLAGKGFTAPTITKAIDTNKNDFDV